MEEAMYLVQYADVAVPGAGLVNGGVLVLETNRAFGGDSSFAYIGTYEIVNGTITARAKIFRHSQPGSRTAWSDAADRFDVVLTGRDTGPGVIDGTMARAGYPTLPMRLTLLDRLP